MKRRLFTIVVLVALVGLVVQRRSQPDFAESTDRSAVVHSAVVEVVTASFGAPTKTQRYMSPSSCGGLGGPSGEEALVLIADWELAGFEEERVTSLLDEVGEFLGQLADAEAASRSTDMSGALRIGVRGRTFRTTVVGPAPDSASFVLSVATISDCGDPSSLGSG